jgi:hypothetical protein
MDRKKALELLGLDSAVPDLTHDIVLEAFRARAKMAHPDTASESNLTHFDAHALTVAKKVLLESLQGTDLCCRLCKGRGMVRASMGFRRCVACHGTGERK